MLRRRLSGFSVRRTAPPPKPSTPTPRRINAKFVVKTGSVPSISAGGSETVVEYEIPKGYAFELVYLGIQPDYDPATGASYAYHLKVAKTGDTFWPPEDDKALCRAGLNWFSPGTANAKKPLFKFDEPGRRGNLTLKFPSGSKAQVIVFADPDNDAGAVKGIIAGYLYDNEDLTALFGAGVNVNNFDKLPGGANQGNIRKFLWIHGDYNTQATSGKQRPDTVLQREVQDWERITLTHVGFKGTTHTQYMRLFDTRRKWTLPYNEPYFYVVEGFNGVPFGDADEFAEPLAIPRVTVPVFNNTVLRVDVWDDGNAVPAKNIWVQFRGIYETLG